MYSTRNCSFSPFLLQSKKKSKKGKNIENNSGNFFALYNKYLPALFTLFDNHNRDLTDIISTNLMYGLRRSYGEHFHLEFEVGFGYYEEFNLKPYTEDDSGIYPTSNFRIGYQF